MNSKNISEMIITAVVAIIAIIACAFILKFAFSFIVFILPIVAPIALAIAITCIRKRNRIVEMQNEIERCKSQVKTAKAKYLSIQRNAVGIAGIVQKNEGDRYKEFNGTGAISVEGPALSVDIPKWPNLNDHFKESSELVMKLFTDFQETQTNLNNAVNRYNTYIQTFPNNIVAKYMGAVPAKLIDGDNLDSANNLELEDKINYRDLV